MEEVPTSYLFANQSVCQSPRQPARRHTRHREHTDTWRIVRMTDDGQNGFWKKDGESLIFIVLIQLNLATEGGQCEKKRPFGNFRM